MSEPSREDQAVTDSGGTMTRLTARRATSRPTCGCSGPRRSAYDDPCGRRAARRTRAGQVVTWHYGQRPTCSGWSATTNVGWSPGCRAADGSWRPADGGSCDDCRSTSAAPAGEWTPSRALAGPGILLRIAPTGVPWSIWYFTDEDGSFEGHYVNLELVHERPVDGSRGSTPAT